MAHHLTKTAHDCCRKIYCQCIKSSQVTSQKVLVQNMFLLNSTCDWSFQCFISNQALLLFSFTIKALKLLPSSFSWHKNTIWLAHLEDLSDIFMFLGLFFLFLAPLTEGTVWNRASSWSFDWTCRASESWLDWIIRLSHPVLVVFTVKKSNKRNSSEVRRPTSVACKTRCVAATLDGDVVISVRLILLGNGLHTATLQN